jgi:PPK2 family polyphosphate:nucleotide phosphotransferase
LKDFDPGFTGPFKSKEEAREKLEKDVKQLAKYQDILYAQQCHSLLIILQGIDTAGKDGLIRHVMSGVNAQGTQVQSFKEPSAEELRYDFLWRTTKVLPRKGEITIFNRSYYEEVLVARVHPELLEKQKLPPGKRGKKFWKERFQAINDLERHLTRNGTAIVKLFLNLSEEEQKRRLLARIETPEKNWKFCFADLKERECWDKYQQAFEAVVNHTSTEEAPWYILPADHKWFTRAVAAEVIVEKLKSLKLTYPILSKEQKRQLLEGKRILKNEK